MKEGLFNWPKGKTFVGTMSVMIAAVLFITCIPMVYGADPGFPKKPINFYIPFPPGGFIDMAHRPLAEEVGKILGQPVVPVNKPGASGTLAATMLKSMEPNGYNIAIATGSLFQLPPQENVSFDPSKDFTYICRTIDSLMGIVVRADSPWKTLKDLLSYAKANPGKIKYATASPRGTMRLTMSDIALKEGIKWDVVPFAGGQEVITALLGKHVDVIIQGMEWIPHVESGELHLLAVLGEQRSKRFPKAPTIKELGYPTNDAPLGIIGPAGMPKDVTDKIAAAFKKALNDPKVQKVLAEVSAPIVYQDSAEYTVWTKSAIVRSAEQVRDAGLQKK